jgi:hypothetical protein
MKITLTRMDTEGFAFLCEERDEVGDKQSVKVHHGLHSDSEVDVTFYQGQKGSWDRDNANPQRRGYNTCTLTAVRNVSFVKVAIEAVKKRFAELEESYKEDHSMFDARREIYEHRRGMFLAALLLEIQKDPTGSYGGISVAAYRYEQLECPQHLDNPFAYLSRMSTRSGRKS